MYCTDKKKIIFIDVYWNDYETMVVAFLKNNIECISLYWFKKNFSHILPTGPYLIINDYSS